MCEHPFIEVQLFKERTLSSEEVVFPRAGVKSEGVPGFQFCLRAKHAHLKSTVAEN